MKVRKGLRTLREGKTKLLRKLAKKYNLPVLEFGTGKPVVPIEFVDLVGIPRKK